MRTLPTLASQLGRDRKGTTAIEFTLLTPILLMSVLGLSEVGYQAYVSSVLEGALNEAGRNSTLEDAAQEGRIDAIDARVEEQVKAVAPNARFASERKAYASFAEVGKPEPFNDLNKDGVRDPGECYEDLNGNGAFDMDRGRMGQGGADDIVNYTMTVTYPRLLPVTKIFGWSDEGSVSATTVLRNQPYGNQAIPQVECKN